MSPSLPFTPEEYERRLAAVREIMADRGLDLLVVTEPSNMFYLTGYDAWSFYVVQAVLVTPAGPPVWIGRYMDAVSARMTTYLPDDNIRPYPDRYVDGGEQRAETLIAEAIVEAVGERGTVGVEMDAYYYSARSHAELVKALPNMRFVDADRLVNWVRIRKSDAERAYMRQAGKIAERVIERAAEMAEPGVRECDLAAAIYHQEISGTPDFGGTYTTSHPYLCCGERAVAPHAVWTDQPLRTGTPINLEIAGCRYRYHAPVSRTIYLGRPPDTYRKLADTVVDGLEAALATVRPGRACEEVEQVWRARLAKQGIEKEARIGYSVGIGYPPTWGERTASLRPGDRTELRPGMAFHMMTGLWLDAVGVTITQAFLVTETGHEPLTSLPRELIVKS